MELWFPQHSLQRTKALNISGGMVERLARSCPKLRINWQRMASRGARAIFLKCGGPWYIFHPLEDLKTQVTFTQRLSVKVLQPKAIMGMPTEKQVILIFHCSQGRRMLTPRTLKVPQQRGSQRSYGNVVLAWVIWRRMYWNRRDVAGRWEQLFDWVSQ